MNEEFGESCDYARPDDACTPDGVVYAGPEPNRGLLGFGVRSLGVSSRMPGGPARIANAAEQLIDRIKGRSDLLLSSDQIGSQRAAVGIYPSAAVALEVKAVEILTTCVSFLWTGDLID